MDERAQPIALLRSFNAENFPQKGIHHRVYGRLRFVISFVKRWIQRFNAVKEIVPDRK